MHLGSSSTVTLYINLLWCYSIKSDPMHRIQSAKIVRVNSFIQNWHFCASPPQILLIVKQATLFATGSLDGDLEKLYCLLKNKPPLNHVSSQHLCLRKAIQCISWRPSLMPSRNNHQMNLLFNFDLALIPTLCIQMQCKSVAGCRCHFEWG